MAQAPGAQYPYLQFNLYMKEHHQAGLFGPPQYEPLPEYQQPLQIARPVGSNAASAVVKPMSRSEHEANKKEIRDTYCERVQKVVSRVQQYHKSRLDKKPSTPAHSSNSASNKMWKAFGDFATSVTALAAKWEGVKSNATAQAGSATAVGIGNTVTVNNTNINAQSDAAAKHNNEMAKLILKVVFVIAAAAIVFWAGSKDEEVSQELNQIKRLLDEVQAARKALKQLEKDMKAEDGKFVEKQVSELFTQQRAYLATAETMLERYQRADEGKGKGIKVSVLGIVIGVGGAVAEAPIIAAAGVVVFIAGCYFAGRAYTANKYAQKYGRAEAADQNKAHNKLVKFIAVVAAKGQQVEPPSKEQIEGKKKTAVKAVATASATAVSAAIAVPAGEPPAYGSWERPESYEAETAEGQLQPGMPQPSAPAFVPSEEGLPNDLAETGVGA